MKSREFKDAVFEQFARLGQAFSSPKRLELLDVLAQGQRDVDTLARETGLSIANASRHLQQLKASRLVATRREGVRIFYRIATPLVLRCLKGIQALAESQLAEVNETVRAFMGQREAMETISRDELLQRVRRGDVMVLDVRPAEEFRAGHIPGAVSIPLGELRKRLREIPRHRRVVAYCRGPYCVLAVEAISILRAAGRQAIRLQDGLPEWRQTGLPVDVSTEEVSP